MNEKVGRSRGIRSYKVRISFSTKEGKAIAHKLKSMIRLEVEETLKEIWLGWFTTGFRKHPSVLCYGNRPRL